MKLTFLGAARIVTGSCYLIETDKKKILVDCGMFQGSKLVRDLNSRPFAFNPGEIDAVVLTHAHVDHSGLLPRLVKEGFKGRIHCTRSTRELCGILLPDSAHIQESDAEYANRKGMRQGLPEVKPLFTLDDAALTLKLFEIHDFDETFEVAEGITARLLVAGHILGSAIVQMEVKEADKKTRLVFTGDVGQPNQPIIEDPDVISGADFITTESTYGDRLHQTYDKEGELARIVNEAVKKGGNIIIPAFAVGRTQVLLYYFQKLLLQKKIPEIPIYVDSPMAIKATNITLSSKEEFDEEMQGALKILGDRALSMKNVHYTTSADESKMINTMPGPLIILSASGMADAGRVLHHLKHNLWKKEATVVFAGFMAEGTLGRSLIDGAKKVKIMGETISVAATIENLKGFSAHADRAQLLDWYKKMPEKPKAFFVTHGEVNAAVTLGKELQMQLGCAAYVPQLGDSVEITGSDYTIKAAPVTESTPEILELRAYMASLEKDYLQYKNRIDQTVLRDGDKTASIKKKLEKVRKYIDDMLGSI